MNMIIKEVYQLSNINDIKIRYKIQSHIAHKFILVMDYHNRKYFTRHFLQLMRYMHFEILKLSRELNRAYTYQILLDLAVHFTLITCGLYNIYFSFALKLTDLLTNKENLLFLVWIIISSTKTIFLNNHCNNYYREVEITAQLLRELEICYLDNSIKDEVQQFSLQLLLHPLQFTAGGYILNNKLSMLFFSTIATYLIVLIQISSTSNLIQPLSHISNH
ncbi:gustatory receptor for sugar taste 43a-like [Apis florea]|uniref:gustatory receptor for sugar taste 43a-like n=1 Tax=Apis florea TaxID=7463 RepID=UPI000629BAA2|nr:gustatory receptor for sugar taste 43a-like [Apis florea]